MSLNSADIHPLFEIKKQCLHCNKEFSVLKLRSKYYVTKEIERDFRVRYYEKPIMVEPSLYNIFVCEHCGFTFNEKFSTYFKSGIKEKIEEKVTSNWLKRSYCKDLDLNEGIVMYNLAIYCGNLKEESSFVLGSLYLNLAWLYKDLNKESNYIKSISFALNCFIESYSNGDYSKHNYSEYYILYMIAYFHYILNNYKDSIKYLSIIITNQKHIQNQVLIDNALNLWEDIRSL